MKVIGEKVFFQTNWIIVNIDKKYAKKLSLRIKNAGKGI